MCVCVCIVTKLKKSMSSASCLMKTASAVPVPSAYISVSVEESATIACVLLQCWIMHPNFQATLPVEYCLSLASSLLRVPITETQLTSSQRVALEVHELATSLMRNYEKQPDIPVGAPKKPHASSSDVAHFVQVPRWQS